MRLGHRRRHSSQLALALEQELSLVREEGEEHEAALEAVLGRLGRMKMIVQIEAGEAEDVERAEDHFKDVGELTTSTDATTSVSGNNDTEDVSIGGLEPMRSRFATLESIPEDEWSIIDVPADYAPSLRNGLPVEDVDGWRGMTQEMYEPHSYRLSRVRIQHQEADQDVWRARKRRVRIKLRRPCRQFSPRLTDLPRLPPRAHFMFLFRFHFLSTISITTYPITLLETPYHRPSPLIRLSSFLQWK